jgi:DNA (cytosine-5)-methyltransferase 1
MKVASVFSGIGGIETGLHSLGYETKVFCEIDPAARQVLSTRFPGVPIVDDVRAMDRLPRGTELLTAGFPCQDISQAGATRGIVGHRSGLVRHLLRLLNVSRPPWVLIENVPFLLRLHKGAGISLITRQLEELGYYWAYRVVDTRAFGLPQRRERVILLASLHDDPGAALFHGNRAPIEKMYTGSEACGFYWTEGNRGLGWAVDSVPTLKGGSSLGIPSPPAIWLPDGRLITPHIRDAERLQGLPANWTAPASQVRRSSYRWTLVGNAVSVPVARWIGRQIQSEHHETTKSGRRMLPGEKWPPSAFGGPGRTPQVVPVGTWPVCRASKPLTDFLKFETKPLSVRAASGFWFRLANSRLERPRKFDGDLRRHIRNAEAR